jgi:hypothetical protein
MRRSAAPSQRSFNLLVGTSAPTKSNEEILALLATRHLPEQEAGSCHILGGEPVKDEISSQGDLTRSVTVPRHRMNLFNDEGAVYLDKLRCL